MKTCTKCKQEKELTEFYKRSKDKHKNECKTCSKERTMQWVEANRAKHNKYQNDYYHSVKKHKKVI